VHGGFWGSFGPLAPPSFLLDFLDFLERVLDFEVLEEDDILDEKDTASEKDDKSGIIHK
jgi:hypothetical protein